ncbi:MAG: hypothetical protein QXI58_00570 [Candidatus Micrarchaeia archaeon]
MREVYLPELNLPDLAIQTPLPDVYNEIRAKIDSSFDFILNQAIRAVETGHRLPQELVKIPIEAAIEETIEAGFGYSIENIRTITDKTIESISQELITRPASASQIAQLAIPEVGTQISAELPERIIPEIPIEVPMSRITERAIPKAEAPILPINQVVERAIPEAEAPVIIPVSQMVEEAIPTAEAAAMPMEAGAIPTVAQAGFSFSNLLRSGLDITRASLFGLLGTGLGFYALYQMLTQRPIFQPEIVPYAGRLVPAAGLIPFIGGQFPLFLREPGAFLERFQYRGLSFLSQLAFAFAEVPAWLLTWQLGSALGSAVAGPIGALIGGFLVSELAGPLTSTLGFALQALPYWFGYQAEIQRFLQMAGWTIRPAMFGVFPAGFTWPERIEMAQAVFEAGLEAWPRIPMGFTPQIFAWAAERNLLFGGPRQIIQQLREIEDIVFSIGRIARTSLQEALGIADLMTQLGYRVQDIPAALFRVRAAQEFVGMPGGLIMEAMAGGGAIARGLLMPPRIGAELTREVLTTILYQTRLGFFPRELVSVYGTPEQMALAATQQMLSAVYTMPMQLALYQVWRTGTIPGVIRQISERGLGVLTGNVIPEEWIRFQGQFPNFVRQLDIEQLEELEFSVAKAIAESAGLRREPESYAMILTRYMGLDPIQAMRIAQTYGTPEGIALRMQQKALKTFYDAWLQLDISRPKFWEAIQRAPIVYGFLELSRTIGRNIAGAATFAAARVAGWATTQIEYLRVGLAEMLGTRYIPHYRPIQYVPYRFPIEEALMVAGVPAIEAAIAGAIAVGGSPIIPLIEMFGPRQVILRPGWFAQLFPEINLAAEYPHFYRWMVETRRKIAETEWRFAYDRYAFGRAFELFRREEESPDEMLMRIEKYKNMAEEIRNLSKLIEPTTKPEEVADKIREIEKRYNEELPEKTRDLIAKFLMIKDKNELHRIITEGAVREADEASRKGAKETSFRKLSKEEFLAFLVTHPDVVLSYVPLDKKMTLGQFYEYIPHAFGPIWAMRGPVWTLVQQGTIRGLRTAREWLGYAYAELAVQLASRPEELPLARLAIATAITQELIKPTELADFYLRGLRTVIDEKYFNTIKEALDKTPIRQQFLAAVEELSKEKKLDKANLIKELKQRTRDIAKAYQREYGEFITAIGEIPERTFQQALAFMYMYTYPLTAPTAQQATQTPEDADKQSIMTNLSTLITHLDSIVIRLMQKSGI